MTIKHLITDRGISEILHFTTQKGAVGVLAARALKSRFLLPQDKYLQHILHVNSASRPEENEYFDKRQNWLDYVNLSISEINKSYFDFSKKWHQNGDIWWLILSFSSEICSHDGVQFATTNNSYEYCERALGVDGLKSLFDPMVRRKNNWVAYRKNRVKLLTTCQQAEVLYPRAVSTDWLRKIYVTCGEHQDLVVGWLRELDHTGVEVLIQPEKFIGQPN